MAGILDGLGGMGGMFFTIASTSIFWVIILILFAGVLIFALVMRKRRKFKIPVLKYIDLGNGKAGFVSTKAGIFKRGKRFFGLFEYGDESEMITKNKEIIYGFTSSDFHEMNYKNTIFVMASPDDPKTLFPISRVRVGLQSQALLLDVAPIELREAAADAFKKSAKELRDKTEQIVQWVLAGLFFLVAFLVILFITQYGKHMVDAAQATNKETLQALLKMGELLAQNANSVVTNPSGAP